MDKIPDKSLSAEEISKYLRINVDILKKEITDHINSELKRFANELNSIKNEGHLS